MKSARSPAWLRPSNLPRLAKCPASGASSDGLPSARSDASALGTAAHELFALVMTEGSAEAARRIGAIARRHCVSLEQLAGWLGDMAVSMTVAPDSSVYSERPLTVEIGGVTVAGTADLVVDHAGLDLVEIVDLKTGTADYVESDHFWQLACYALAAARELGRTRALASLYYIQHGADGWYHQELDLGEVEPQLTEIVRNALAQVEREPSARTYRTGDHCQFCPARALCPARTVELREFASLAPSHTWEITADNAAAVLERARAIERVTAAARDAVKEYVRANGPVPAGEGLELRLVTVQRKEYVVAASVSEQLRTVKVTA